MLDKGSERFTATQFLPDGINKCGYCGGQWIFGVESCLSCRDKFARAAMTGCVDSEELRYRDIPAVAKLAYALADAMMLQRATPIGDSLESDAILKQAQEQTREECAKIADSFAESYQKHSPPFDKGTEKVLCSGASLIARAIREQP